MTDLNVQKLLAEANRFDALARAAAIKFVVENYQANSNVFIEPGCNAKCLQQLAHDHMIRAETFRAAAALIAPPPQSNLIPFQPHG